MADDKIKSTHCPDATKHHVNTGVPGCKVVKKILHEVEEVECIVKVIRCLLKSPTFGLKEIKSEIRAIESAVGVVGGVSEITSLLLSPTFGLEEIKTEVASILDLLNNNSFGLAEIKSEIKAIESAVGVVGGVSEITSLLLSPTFGLEEIKTEVREILSQVTSPSHGLHEIKVEIEDILSLLNNASFGLAEIKSEIRALETSTPGTTPSCLTTGPFIVDNGVGEIDVKVANRTTATDEVAVTLYSWDPCKSILSAVTEAITPGCSTHIQFNIVSSIEQAEVQICGIVPGIFAFVAGRSGNQGGLHEANVFRFAELIPQVNPDDP